jgi:hypothetical protein
MYKAKTDLGTTWRRHVDQIKPSKIAEDIAQNTPLIEEPSVKTTESTKTDVQTDNINDKPIDVSLYTLKVHQNFQFVLQSICGLFPCSHEQ